METILVFFGGGNCTNDTLKVLQAYSRLNHRTIGIDVIVSNAFSQRQRIESLCHTLPNARYFCQLETVAERMAYADLAIGAGGTITWERCCLGLPSIVLTIAQNQIAPTQHAALLGVLNYLGESSQVDEETLASAIDDLIDNKEALSAMSNAAYHLVDGMGCDRVIKYLC